jgi:hypothetical protein
VEGSLIQAPVREPVRVYSSLDMPAPRSRRAISRRLAPLGLGPVGGVPHAGGTAVINLASYFTPANVLQSVQTDLGLTLGTSWLDQSSNGKNYTGTVWPTLGTGLNGFSSLIFNGTSQYLVSSLNLPAATTPTWLGIVFRQITWINNRAIIGDNTSVAHLLFSFVSTPSIYQYCGNTANLNSSPAVNSWECTEAYFSGSTSDYFRRGLSTNSVGGTSSGNAASTGRCIGASSAGGSPSNIEVLAVIHVAGLPSGAQISNWRAAVATKYGGSVAV